MNRIIVLVLAICLTASGIAVPAHAKSAAGSEHWMHEMQAVQSYADLAIELGENCPHAVSDQSQDTHGKPCKTCCTACVTTTVMPAAPGIAAFRLAGGERLQMTSETLHGRSIPTEPGIPKRP